MHKKYHKFGNKDLHRKHSSSKKEHVRHKKEHESNHNDLIRVPQNSKSEIHKKRESKVHLSKSKHKHREHSKHKKSDKAKLSERHSARPDKHSHRSKSEGQKKIKSVENVALKNEGGVKHRDKAEKHDKDRLNKIEKYLEGINKFYSKNKGQTRSSISMRSSDTALKQREKQKHLRREKTFHAEKTKRDDSKGSPKPKTKKHGHKDEKDREASKEKHIKKLQKQVMYCHVDVQEPFKAAARNIPVENLYPKEHKGHKEKHSSKTRKYSGSRDRHEMPPGEGARHGNKSSKAAHHHSKRTRDGGTLESTHLAPRMSQVKALKHKGTKSAVNLGLYNKYFVFDKSSPTEIDKGKRQHRKTEKTSAKYSKVEYEEEVTRESRRKKPDRPKQQSIEIPQLAEKDQYREKIEDDLKTYFTKIQTLIDKKLDFILNTSSKESKLRVNELEALPTDKPKHKREMKQEEVYNHAQLRKRKRKKSRKRNKVVDSKKAVREAERSSKKQESVTMLKNDIKNEEGVRHHKQKEEIKHHKPKEEEIRHHKQKEEDIMRYQKQKEEELRRYKQKEEEIRRKQKEEEMLRYQKQKEEEMLRYQKQKEEEARRHKQKEEEMRRQKLREEETRHLKQKEEEARHQKQKEEEMRYQKQKEEEMRHQLQKEEEMRRHKQKEEEMRHHKQKEEEMRRHRQKDEDMRHHKHKEEEIRRHKHNEDEIGHYKPTEEDLYHHKHHKTPKKHPSMHDRMSQHQLTMDESRRYKQPELDRNVSPDNVVNVVQNVPKYTYSKEQVIIKEIHEEVQYEDMPRHKTQGDMYHNRNRRERSSCKSNGEEGVPPPGNFFPEVVEPNCHRKKSKKRLKRLNLECKTISIVGIPSQPKESATFDGTQTTTSLNVVNPVEDAIERKKQSRRFKLYYKYSVGNNKPPSGHSSDGKSIISDSYRIVSDPSEHASDLWVENVDDVQQEENIGSGKVLFIMKGETSGNECGDITNGNNIVVRKSRVQRVTTPSASMLKNIIEEPSNVSCSEDNHDILRAINNELDCTFFNILRSSSSDCNVHLKKKAVPKKVIPAACKGKSPTRPVVKHVDNQKKPIVEKAGHPENKPDKKIKVRKIKSHHKIKPKPFPDAGPKYSSKSDIDISYDSLQLSKHFRIQVNKGEFRPTFKYSLAQKNKNQKTPEPARNQQGKNTHKFLVELSKDIGEEDVCVGVQTRKDQQQTAPFRIPKFEELRDKTGCVEHKKDVNRKQHTETENRNQHPIKKTPGTSVTRIPSLINKRHLPDLRDLGYVLEEMELLKKQANSEKTKKYVDVGIEVNTMATIVHEETPPTTKKLRPKTPESVKDAKLITCHRRGYTRTSEIAVEASIDPEQTLAVQMNNSLQKDQPTLWEPKSKGALSQECRRQNTSTEVPIENKANTTKTIVTKVNFTRPSSALDRSRKKENPTVQKPIQKPTFNRTKTALDKASKASCDSKKRSSREVKRPDTPRGRSVGTSSIKVREVPRERSVGTSSIKVAEDHPRERSVGTSSKDREEHDRTYFEGDSSETPSKCSVALNTGSDPERKRPRQIRSLSCSEKSSRGNKYNTFSSSKSEMSVFNLNVESKITSLVCLNKFLNSAKAGNFSSNSNSKSLDQYTAKSIIGDQPHVSRLFLTKSFNPQINSYQRRKMYSEALRQKMLKKKGEVRSRIAPQVFEVRFLTVGTEIVKEESEAANQTKSHSKNSLSKTPTYNCKAKTVQKAVAKKLAPKPCIKKLKKPLGKSKENVLKFSGRNIFTPVATEPSFMNKLKEEKMPLVKVEKNKTDDTRQMKETDKVVEELKEEETSVQEKQDSIFEYFKKLDDIKSSSLLLKDTGASLEDFKRKLASASAEGGETDQNFLQLVDYLYKSIVTYCNSRFSLVQDDLPEPPRKSRASSRTPSTYDMKNNAIQRRPSIPTINEQSLITHKPQQEKDPKETDIASSESAMETKPLSSKSQGIISKPVTQPPKVSSHSSCPVIAPTAPSFEFLYEDESAELTKEAILATLKPVDTFLGYALNSTVPVNPKVFTKKLDQFSSVDSESGYTSNSSRKCSSVNSFFKKPNVAALLRPVPHCKLEVDAKESKQSVAGTSVKSYGPTKEEYNRMVQKCQEYAQKVRFQCQRSGNLDEAYEEIPLDVLLQKRSSSLFENCTSSCSLCQSDVNSDVTNDSYDKVDAAAKSRAECEEKKSDRALVQSKNTTETLFHFEKKRRPSVEVITIQKSFTKIASTDSPQSLLREMMDCKVVVSSTNLSRGSITLIDSAQMRGKGNPFAEDLKEDDKNQSVTEKVAKPTDDLDMALDHAMISSLLSTQFVDIPIKMKKLLAKKFFENLLSVYEKEIALTTQLFQDEDFFINQLMGAVKAGNEGAFKKQAKGKSKCHLAGRIRQYLSNVFSTRNSSTMGSRTQVDALDKNVADQHQEELQMLARNARRYFSPYVQAVRANKDINDEMKICGLLKLLERIENGDFTILRKEEEVNFEEEIKDQVKQAFVEIYAVAMKEAKKNKRSLSPEDLELIRTFVSKYRIGLLSKTDLIASYIGRGIFKSENELKAAVTYLVRLQTKDIDSKDFDNYCKLFSNCKK